LTTVTRWSAAGRIPSSSDWFVAATIAAQAGVEPRIGQVEARVAAGIAMAARPGPDVEQPHARLEAHAIEQTLPELR
jgi:hypothetical protein